MPFTNRSGLPEDDVFAEGMVEDVIWALSQGVNARVLGSSATAALSRAAITDLAAIGRQLGVHYLLEGNIRRVGANMRVTTQLLEAQSGTVQWAARFERPLSELAALQEALVAELAASLDAQVFTIEMQRALKKPSDITAWEAVLRSWSAYRNWGAAGRARAIAEAERAVAIAPDYAPAYGMLATALADDYLVAPDNSSTVQRIRTIADRAIALDPEDASVLGSIGCALAYIGYPNEAVRHTAKSISKTPGSGVAHFSHGITSYLSNDPETALAHFDICERLSPGWLMMWAVHSWRYMVLGRLGRWPEAMAAAQACIAQAPDSGVGQMNAAMCAAKLGDETAARGYVAEMRRLGWGLASTEILARRLSPGNDNLETDIAIMRKLFAATDPPA